MKKQYSILMGVLAFCLLATQVEAAPASAPYGGVTNDIDMLKNVPWRARAPWLPIMSYRYGVGYTPAWFAPANADASPYVSGSFGVGLGWALRQAGVRGYWSDLGFNASWGLMHYISDNMGGGQFARQTYSRDIGLSVGKALFREKNTGIALSFGVGFKVPISLASQQRTLITSIAPNLGISKTFFGRLSLSYSFSMNFNFYEQDSGRYNPDFAGIPGLNQRWGMNHSFGLGVRIVRGLSVGAGVGIGVGYSFADAYATNDGPQVFGAENLSAADLASYAINEGNFYSLSLSIRYRFNQFIGISASYSNGGPQYVFVRTDSGGREWVLRNPFRLQNSSFSFGLSGSI